MSRRTHWALRALLPLTFLLAAASSPSRVVRIHLEGPPGFDLGGLRAVFFPLIDTTPTPEMLLDAVERAAADDQLGGIDIVAVPVDPDDDRGDVGLTIVFDGQPRIVELVDVAVATGVGNDHRQGLQLWRRVRARGRGLQLSQGRRFHPYHLRLDKAALRRWYERRGHLAVEIHGTPVINGELTTIDIRALPGPQYTLGKVSVLGPTAGVTVARLRTDVGERPSPAGISKAEERLRSALCRQGFPYTAAKASQTRLAEAVLDLEFEIDVGGSPVRIVDVRVVGAKLPGDLLEAVGLTPGASYCRDLAGEASDVVGAYLRDNGFPNALVFVESRRRGPNKVAIHVTVDKRERATVSRVWFRGHKVTLEKVLRQLVSVKPGQRFQQSEIARSVENLRRSGLFRRVSHSVIESLDVGDIYVVFDLVESDLLEVDFGARTVFLHNMDISWPSSVAAATDGVTLRGGGQRVRLTGASDHVGVGIRDPFLWSGLLATGDIDLVFHSFSDLEETETKIQVGAGLTALENQFEAILLMFLSQTVRGAPNAYDVLPFRGDRGGASAGLGLALRLDLTRLDAERIAYLGLGLNASARSADLLAGKPWTSTSTAAALNLPLFRNGRGQHYVLQLKSRWRLLFDAGISGGSFADDDELYAHRMLTPRARGYAGTALRATHLVDGKEILIGHRATWESTVAVRIPLPFRRNAIRVFADLASGGPLELRPWDPDTIRPGIGIGLDFSLFDERLEGTLDGTYPLSDGPAVEYYSLAVGGSFD